MASLNDAGMGIGDFAQALLEQEATNPQPQTRKASSKGNVPDISDVPVSKDQVNSVLFESFGIQEKKKSMLDVARNPEKAIKKEPKRTDEELRSEISKTVKYLKSLLQEMTVGTTTTGMGGAHSGLGFKNPKPKRRRSSKGR